MEGGPKNPEDDDFCSQVAYPCPDPLTCTTFNLKNQLALALYTAQETLKKIAKTCRGSKKKERRIKLILDCAAFLHFEIVRIQPFPHGNSRLARLLARLYSPKIASSRFLLTLEKSIKKPLSLNLAIQEKLMMRRHAQLPNCFMTLWINRKKFWDCFRDKASIFDAQMETLMRETLNPISSSNPAEAYDSITCGWCFKPSTDACKLSRCGRCLTTAYCSKECQKSHWTYHKPVCSMQTTADARQKARRISEMA